MSRASGFGVSGAGEAGDGDGGVVRPDGAAVVAQRAEAAGLGRHRAQSVGVGHVRGGEPCGDGVGLVGVECAGGQEVAHVARDGVDGAA